MKGILRAVALAVFATCLTVIAPGQPSPLENTQPPKLNFNHIPVTTTGPFGLTLGMTKDQIIERVGKDNVPEIEADELGGAILLLRTVPKPHPAFSAYMVEVSATQGLLRIDAFGEPLNTSEDGTELKYEFSSLKEQLLTTYGIPTHDEDSLKPGSIWREPRDFMMGLIKKDRKLIALWRSEGPPINGSIINITLRAEAKDTSTGNIALSYSFVGWDEYYERLTAKRGSVL